MEIRLKDISKQIKDCKGYITLRIKKKFSEEDIKLEIGNYYKLLEFVKTEKATDNQLMLRKVWAS